MSYINISHSSIVPMERFIEKELIDSDSFVDELVISRVAYLALAPLSFLTSALDTVIGLGAGVAVLLTAGTERHCLKAADNYLEGSRKILVRPFENLLKVLNPNAIVMRDIKRPSDQDAGGITASFPLMLGIHLIDACDKSTNFFMEHVVSRLTFALMGISCLVTRAIDGFFGIIAATFAFLTFGIFEELNDFAYLALQAPGVIDDLFYCCAHIINPWTRYNLR